MYLPLVIAMVATTQFVPKVDSCGLLMTDSIELIDNFTFIFIFHGPELKIVKESHICNHITMNTKSVVHNYRPTCCYSGVELVLVLQKYIRYSCPQVFAAGVQCVTSVLGDRPRRMLTVIQRFDKHYSCHLQDECVEVGRFWKPYIGQAVGGE
jgi:hypothetical protein